MGGGLDGQVKMALLARFELVRCGMGGEKGWAW